MQEWNGGGMMLMVKTEVPGEKPVPMSLYAPQISHALTRDGTRPSAVRGWRLGFNLSYI